MSHTHTGQPASSQTDPLAGLSDEQIAHMGEIVAAAQARAAQAKKDETQERAAAAARRIKAAATHGAVTTKRVGATTGIVIGKSLLGLWQGVFSTLADVPNAIADASIIAGFAVKDVYDSTAPKPEEAAK